MDDNTYEKPIGGNMYDDNELIKVLNVQSRNTIPNGKFVDEYR